MQRAEVVNIPRRSGSERAGSRVGRNLIRHEKSRIAGYAGPMRHRVVVGPHNVVSRLDFRQWVWIKVRTGWFGCVCWVDVDEPLKRHVANSSLQVVPAVFETSVFPTARLSAVRSRIKIPLAPAGSASDSVVSPNSGARFSGIRRLITQLRLRSGGGTDESRFPEQIRRRLTLDLLCRQWKSAANYQNSYLSLYSCLLH